MFAVADMKHCLVLRLGGSSTDVSIVRMQNSGKVVLSKHSKDISGRAIDT